MSADESEMRKLAKAWKRAAPALRAMRHADIRRQDNAQTIEALDSLFRETIKRNPPRTSSGFVEMYRILSRQKNGSRR
jgi:hypothetical protein